MWKVRRGCWGLPFQMTPELCELFVPFDLFAGDPLNVLWHIGLDPYAESPQRCHGHFMWRFCLHCDARRTQNKPHNLPGSEPICRRLHLRSSCWREWVLPADRLLPVHGWIKLQPEAGLPSYWFLTRQASLMSATLRQYPMRASSWSAGRLRISPSVDIWSTTPTTGVAIAGKKPNTPTWHCLVGGTNEICLEGGGCFLIG